MSKKIIKLSEEELRQVIYEAVVPMLSETDAATYSRIHNASHRATQGIQSGNNARTNGRKCVDNNDVINRTDKIGPVVQSHWLKDFIGKTFKFFSRTQMGLVANVLFKLENVKKSDYNKTILVGEVTFNENKINSDDIIVDFAKSRIQYHDKRSRYSYNLEIDNRFKQLWNELLKELNTAIQSRSKMTKNENITLNELSLAINDNFPNLTLEFVEKNQATNTAYSVDMHFKEIKFINKERCVLKGKLDVASKPFGIGTIEYNFNTQEFYRVSYSDKTTRSKRLHTLIAHNQDVINNLLSFIINFLQQVKDIKQIHIIIKYKRIE